jgi:alpha-mannosidase
MARYQAILTEIGEHIIEDGRRIAGQINTARMAEPVVVYNSLSWTRTEWIAAGDQWIRVTVPPLGYRALDTTIVPGAVPAVTADQALLENDLLRVRFSPDGSIVSVYDKEDKREVIPVGQAANRLVVYADYGDAWDFPMDYAEAAPRYMQLVSSTPRVDGPSAILEQVYHIGHSELVQEIVLVAGSRRLDFRTRVRWREVRSMLRARFPVSVRAEGANFEIQFGHVQRPTHRNTTWDLARDEVAAHKWADLSQRDYGVALLNDAKYGYKVKGNVLDLNLLRSVPYPGPRLVSDEDVQPGEPHHAYTDQCDHVFTYALYPHIGDHVEGRVVQAGYELNVPLRIVSTDVHEGTEPIEASLLQVDVPNVIVEAVKMAEDSSDITIRLYECERRGTRATIHFNWSVRSAVETDLLEQDIQTLEIERNSVRLAFRPFEIKTLKVRR